MGTLFKRRDRGGRGGKWYAQYTGPDGRRTAARSTGTSDKAAAQRIMAKWEADAALRFSGVIDANAERVSSQARRPIEEHLAEFKASLESPGNSAKHVNETINPIKAAVAFARWKLLTDITAEGAERYSGHLRLKLKRSNRTIQKHLNALKQFTGWAASTKRIPIDPIAYLRSPSPDTDRRLERRALQPEEWPYLQAAAQAGPADCAGLSGPDRALLYELTLQTGLRQGEIRELTVGKLHLDQSPPFVMLPSRSTKNKKPARQYVTAGLAKRLASYAAGRAPGLPLFPLPPAADVADMVRADLAAARAAWLQESETKDPRGKKTAQASDFLLPINHEGHRFDFHALRHTCGAWLAAAGENPKTIQTIMRHSSITLTMDTYGHLFPASESDAIARLGTRYFGAVSK